jgi:Regulator of chromosome condensation (RCC1) repeat
LDGFGAVWAWGNNRRGKLGAGASGSSVNAPVRVEFEGLDGASIISVAAGENHSLALDDQGRVWAWGSHISGELGIGLIVDYYTSYPGKVPFGEDAVYIVALSAGGGRNNIALDNAGRAWVWGDYNIPDAEILYSPKKVELGTKNLPVQRIAADISSAYMMDLTGRIWVIGEAKNSNGNWYYANSPAPIPMPLPGEPLPVGIAATREVMAPDFMVLPIVITQKDNYSIGIDGSYNINARLYDEAGAAGHFYMCYGRDFSFNLDVGVYYLVIRAYWEDEAVPLNVLINPGAASGYELIGEFDDSGSPGYGYGSESECGAGAPVYY